MNNFKSIYSDEILGILLPISLDYFIVKTLIVHYSLLVRDYSLFLQPNLRNSFDKRTKHHPAIWRKNTF